MKRSNKGLDKTGPSWKPRRLTDRTGRVGCKRVLLGRYLMFPENLASCETRSRLRRFLGEVDTPLEAVVKIGRGLHPAVAILSAQRSALQPRRRGRPSRDLLIRPRAFVGCKRWNGLLLPYGTG
jgi:hypothetical protein